MHSLISICIFVPLRWCCELCNRTACLNLLATFWAKLTKKWLTIFLTRRWCMFWKTYLNLKQLFDASCINHDRLDQSLRKQPPFPSSLVLQILNQKCAYSCAQISKLSAPFCKVDIHLGSRIVQALNSVKWHHKLSLRPSGSMQLLIKTIYWLFWFSNLEAHLAYSNANLPFLSFLDNLALRCTIFRKSVKWFWDSAQNILILSIEVRYPLIIYTFMLVFLLDADIYKICRREAPCIPI